MVKTVIKADNFNAF